MKKTIFLLLAICMFFLQGILLLPFETNSAEAKESRKYYEDEEDEEDEDAWEQQVIEQYVQPAKDYNADTAAFVARQQELEQQRNQQQQAIEQQALFEQQLYEQRAVIEARQRQLEEQFAAQQRAIEEQNAIAVQETDNLAYSLDTDQDGIEDGSDPHPSEHEAVYAVKDDNKNGISDELESSHAMAWQ
ncbi:MAG: hypothetical protein NUV61_04470 [Candidatus Azambacteria bacterium]|nr:hypothetical protein [Candidatus Azambacteria bacterium]